MVFIDNFMARICPAFKTSANVGPKLGVSGRDFSSTEKVHFKSALIKFDWPFYPYSEAVSNSILISDMMATAEIYQSVISSDMSVGYRHERLYYIDTVFDMVYE